MRSLAFSLFLFLAPCEAQAYDDPYTPGGSTLLDLGRYRTAFSYGGVDHEAHVGRYGIGYYEPVSDDVALSLQGGYLTTDVDGEPAPLPLDFTGRYLGLGLRYESTEGDYLNFSAETSYTWQDVDGNGFSGSSSNLTWYEGWAALGPVLRWQRWRFSFGGYWQQVEGVETDANPAARLDFSAGRSTGAYASLMFYVDDTGSIGIYGTSGARKGLKIVFKREF